MLARIEETLASVRPGEPLPQNRTLVAQAAEMVAAYKQLPKKLRHELEGNELQKVAQGVFDNPLKEVDVNALKGVQDHKDQIMQLLGVTMQKNAVISDDRAKQVAQETMNWMWTQLFPMLGSGAGDPTDSIPKVQIDQVKQVPVTGDMPLLTLRGNVEDGGAFEITMSAYGVPDLSSLTLDLGERHLGSLVEATARRTTHFAAGQELEVTDVTMDPSPRKDGEPYTFTVNAGRQLKTMRISPEGFVDLKPFVS
jgi:hypothetical protein